MFCLNLHCLLGIPVCKMIFLGSRILFILQRTQLSLYHVFSGLGKTLSITKRQSLHFIDKGMNVHLGDLFKGTEYSVKSGLGSAVNTWSPMLFFSSTFLPLANPNPRIKASCLRSFSLFKF